MNRSMTNAVRFVMDECLPPFVRDSKAFMYPFFLFAYRGRNVGTAMNFKRVVHSWGRADYAKYYENLNTISRNRPTDLNGPSLKAILASIDPAAKTLLDVGCGKGFFLEQLKGRGLSLYGTDIVDKAQDKSFRYTQASIEHLPFPDKSFDVVTCFHTLEHIVDLPAAVAELNRVARRQLMVVVPCQRWYFYTLDEHVNFFPYAEKLTSAIGLKQFTCRKVWGDWLYIGVPE
jgi:ubiquinone/menaquinone biosynthesis C-methylase UbiE